jgi:hypothetical protein
MKKLFLFAIHLFNLGFYLYTHQLFFFIIVHENATLIGTMK